MNFIMNLLMAAAFLLGPCVTAIAGGSGKRAPSDVFSVGEFRVGVTDLEGVRALLGAATAAERDDGLVRTICYYYPYAKGGFVVFDFNSSVLGGLQRLTGFVVRRASSRPEKCSLSLVDLHAMRVGMNVRLGDSERDFRGKLPIRFDRKNAALYRVFEYEREMTGEEFLLMREQWPGIKEPAFFSVVESVRAVFKSGFLDFYEVSRSESY